MVKLFFFSTFTFLSHISSQILIQLIFKIKNKIKQSRVKLVSPKKKKKKNCYLTREACVMRLVLNNECS